MDILYKLIKTDRKSVAIKIGENGEIIVRAPRGISKAEADRIVKKHSSWIEKHQAEVLRLRERDELISPDDEKALRSLAKNHLTKLTLHFTEITGLRPTCIKISGAKKRFGSCSSKGNISYSYRLMLYPPAATEYVVLHEICHLRFMDHSENFYALIERYMPDWRERRKLLRTGEQRRVQDVLSDISSPLR